MRKMVPSSMATCNTAPRTENRQKSYFTMKDGMVMFKALQEDFIAT